MKPNNYYYRHIAIKRGYNWDEKFHSSYYFMRKIAESYGYTYTTRKPSNKFLRDFCTSEAEHTPETFEYNVYYLYKIAKKLYPSTEAGKTENYYLRIICENIGGDTPVATDITWTLNNVEEGESAILSHVDGDDAVFVFTVTGENERPVSGYQIPIEVDGVAVSPTPVTDANGQATYTYESSGAGDVAIDVNCTLLTKTYSIHDDLFADSMINSIKSAWSNNGFTITSDANGTLLQNTNGLVDKLLYNINQSSFSVEFDYLTGSGANLSFGFRVENSSNNYSSYLGYYSTKYRFGANAGSEKSITTSAPSNNHMKLEITPTSHKFYIDDVLIEEVNPSNSTTNQYIGFYLSGSAQQFKLKNFEIKPL